MDRSYPPFGRFSLSNKTYLPTFLIYVGDLFDWDMLSFFDPNFRYPIPLFVQEKTKASNTFLIHPRSYDSFANTLQVAGESHIPEWNKRLDQAFWRGSTTGGPAGDYVTRSTRAKLVRLSLEEPEILDARFTECWLDSAACKHLQDSGMMGGSVSHVGQLQYKMVVMVDGNSLPDRFAHQMAMGNVILKQESPHEEFWYRDAIPWVHYIPVAHDLSNLVQRIKEGPLTRLRGVADFGRAGIVSDLRQSSDPI